MPTCFKRAANEPQSDQLASNEPACCRFNSTPSRSYKPLNVNSAPNSRRPARFNQAAIEPPPPPCFRGFLILIASDPWLLGYLGGTWPTSPHARPLRPSGP